MKVNIGLYFIVLVLLMCTACTKVKADHKEIKVWTITQEGMVDFIDGAAESFEALYPDVKIVHESFPNESYKTQIQVALTGSTPPDVFFSWAGEDASRLILDGLVLDITTYGTAEGGFAQSVKENWLSPYVYEGRNYGVPSDAVSKYFYYDPKFFTDHKLSIPKTFDDLIGFCKVVRDIDPSIVPWPLGNSERWKMAHVMTMLNQRVLGLDALAPDYNLSASDQELFTHIGYIEAWSKVLELKAAGCFQEAPNVTSPDASRAMFSAQLSPMIYCGTWCAIIFAAEGYEDFAMFRFPSLDNGAGDPNAQFMVLNGYMVSSKSKHPELAAAFLSHMVSDEQARSFAENIGGAVSNPKGSESVDVKRWNKFFTNDLETVSRPVNVIDVVLEASVANAYMDAGVEILNGTLSPQEAMVKIREAALAAKAKKSRAVQNGL